MKRTELEQWYKEAVEDLRVARQRLSDTQRAVVSAEQKVASLESLYLLEGGKASVLTNSKSQLNADVVDYVETMLQDKGEPMHISDIRAQLLQDQVPLPGKGVEANLIAKFQRSKGRIVRVSRGMYDIPR